MTCGASRRFLSGLLKLMYPHGEVNDEQLGELLSLAIEGRQRVRNQLHLMAAGEYGPVVLTGKLTQSGKIDHADAARRPSGSRKSRCRVRHESAKSSVWP